MQRILEVLMDEPVLYRAYYLMALSTGLRRGELCALRWTDLSVGNQFIIRRSISTAPGMGLVESDTKNHLACAD